MADIESNIRIDIDTTDALSAIKNLQRQISAFHSTMQQSGNAANAAISEGMQRNLINSINATKNFSASLETVKSSSESFTTALEKNKLSMGEYFRYAGASTKTFGKLFTNEFNTIEKVARERVKTIQTQYIKMGRDANGAMQAIKVRPLTLDMQNLGTQVQMAAQKQQIFNQLMKQGSTNLLNFGKNTQWAGRQLMVGFTIPLTMLGTTAVKSFMDMEKAVLKFQRVYGDLGTTAADTDKMAKSIQELANSFTKYGVAVADTMSLAADAAAMGKTGADLTAQVAEATRLAVLGGVEQAQALETTTSLTNAFGVATEDLAKKIDFLNSVENQTVTSIEDLTIAIPKAGPVVKQLGGDVEDLAFFLTAMKEGGINASEGANALKSGLASIINPTAKASEFMAGFGINIKGIVDSNAGDVKGIILGVANALDTLDPLNKAQAIEQMFGKFQFARMSTLFQNVIAEGSQASRVLDMTRQSAEELAILSERELKKVEDSPMFKFQKAIEDIQASLIPLGEEFIKLITPLVEFGVGLLKQFNSLDAGVKQFVMGAIGVLGLIAPAAIMTFGLFANGIANIIKGVGSVNKLFYKLAGAATDASGPMGYFTQEQLEAAAVAASLEQVHSNLTQQFTSETAAVLGLKDAYRQAILAINEYSAAASIARAATTPPTPVAPPITRVPGTRRVQSPGGTIPGYVSGVVSVPGPKGAGDVVPAMLSPGEAVIPADVAERNRGFIAAMINGKIPGFEGGTAGLGVKLNVDRQTADLIKKEFEAYSAVGQEEAAVAQQALQALSEQKRQTTKGWRRLLAFQGSEAGSTPSKTLGKAIDYGTAPAEMKRKKKEISAFRGSQGGTAKQNAESGGRQEEYALSAQISESAHNKLLELGVPETKAANISGYQGASNPGVAMGHKVDVGSAKVLPEGWQQPFVNYDPRMENTLLSSMTSQDKKTTTEVYAAYKAASETLQKAGEITVEEWKDLDAAIKGDKSFTEGQRRTFAKVNKQVAKTEGVGSAMGINATALDVGYDAVDIQKKTGYQKQFSEQEVVAASDKLAKAKADAFGSGITAEQQEKIKQDGKDLVKGLVIGVEEEGEMQSPSRKMFRKGSDLVKGIVNGVKEGFTEANQVGDQLGDAIVNGARPDGLPTPPPGFDPFIGDVPAISPVEDSRATTVGKNLGNKISTGAISAIENSLMNGGFLSKTKTGAMLANTFRLNSGASLIEDIPGETQLSRSKRELAASQQLNQQLNNMTGQNEEADINNGDANALAFDADGNPIVDKKGNQLTQQQHETMLKKQSSAMKRARRAGKVAGALGTATMISGMVAGTGGPMGDIAGQITPFLGGLSAVAPLLMALPAPLAILVGAIGAVAFGLFKMNEHIAKTRQESRELAYAMSSGTKAMDTFAQFAGKATPSEIMAKRRESQFLNFQEKPGKTQFGQNFIESEGGKEYVDTAKKAIAELGSGTASKQMALQLATAVSQGILSKEQASNMAYYIGQSLNDMGVAVQINAKLNELVLNDGTNLLKDPLVIQTQLLEIASENITGTSGSLTKLMEEAADLGAVSWNPWSKEMESVLELEGRVGGEILAFTEQTKASIDALDVSYQDRIANLKKEGKFVEAAAANDEYLEKRSDLLIKTTEEADKFLNKINEIDNRAPDMFDQQQTSLKAVVDQVQAGALAKFEGTEDFDRAKKILEEISDDGTFGVGRDLQASTSIVFNTAINSGDMSLDTAERLLDTFSEDEDEKTLDMIATMMVRYGNTSVQQIDRITSLFGDDEAGKTKKTNFIAMMSMQAPENFSETLDAFTMMAQYDGVLGINASVIVDYYSTYPGKIDELQGKLDGLKKMSEAGKIDIETVISEKYITDPAAAATLRKNAEYFNALDPFQQFIYLQTMLTMQDTVTPGEIKAYLKGKNVKAGGAAVYDPGVGVSYSDENYTSAQMAKGEADLIAERAKAITDAFTFDDSTVTEPEDPKDTGGSKSNPFQNLLSRLKLVRDAAINAAGGIEELNKALAAGGKIAKGLFDGVDQQLTKAGYSAEFIRDMMALDEEQRKQFMTVDKKGKVKVTAAGKAYQEGLKEAAIGEFQASTVRSAADVKYQTQAVDKLVAGGMSSAQAMEIAADANTAYAIATNASTEEIQEFIKWLGILEERQKELDMKTVAGRQKIVSEAMGKVQEYFAAVEAAITSDFEDGTNTSGKNTTGVNLGKERDIISSAQFDIADKQDQIDDLQYLLDGVAEKEDEINEKYDKRAEALEKVWDLNKDIAEEQKGQLDIAQALASGDIASAARAMQAEQQRRAQKAQEDQKANLEKAREKELGAVKSTNGKTRLELEKEIKKIAKEIAVIEETRLEPAEKNVRYGERARDAALSTVTYLGQTKKAWGEVEEAARLAAVQSKEFGDNIVKALSKIPGFKAITKKNAKGEDEVISFEFDSKAFQDWMTGNTVAPVVPNTNVDCSGTPKPKTAPKAGYQWVQDPKTCKWTEQKVGGAGDGSTSTTTDTDTTDKTPQWVKDGKATISANNKKIEDLKKNLTDNAAKIEANKKAIAKLTESTYPGMPVSVISAARTKIAALEKDNDGLRGASGWTSKAISELNTQNNTLGNKIKAAGYNKGGFIKYMNTGGMFSSLGADIVPAMLTPGEFVMSKYSVQKYGVDKLKSMNDGTYSGDSVYNYNLSVNVKSDANPDQIAKAVMTQIRQIDSQRIRSNKY